MKAYILLHAGENSLLKLTDVADPVIAPDEVLVKVKAISLNPVDLKTRNGKALYGSLKAHDPVILGWDISGEVLVAGSAVTRFKQGDEVFGMVNFPGHGKAYAEFVAAPAAHLDLKPVNISHTQAAAATLAALTAYQVLVNEAKVKAGQRVLIHAAAGGVGHFAVQIARHLGAYVIGTSSAANRDFILSIGAHEHLDYEKERFEELPEKVDLVFETVGGAHVQRSLKVVKKGGTVISIVGGFTEEVTQQARENAIDGRGYLVQWNGADMEAIAGLLESGALKPHVSLEVPFSDMEQAFSQVATGKTRGKVVVTK